MSLLEEIREKVPPEILERQDTQAIADFLSQGRKKPRRVPIADIQAQLQTSGSWWSIKAIAKNDEHPAFSAADAVMDVANSRYENVDMALPLVQQMFGALVEAKAMPPSDLDTLNDMAEEPDPVDEFQVRLACLADDGTWRP